MEKGRLHSGSKAYNAQVLVIGLCQPPIFQKHLTDKQALKYSLTESTQKKKKNCIGHGERKVMGSHSHRCGFCG